MTPAIRKNSTPALHSIFRASMTAFSITTLLLAILCHCGPLSRPALGQPNADGREPPETTSSDLGRLPAYLTEAAENNPKLQAAFNRWQATLQRIPQARSLPDPQLTLRGYLQPVETRTGPQQAGIGLSQTVPWFGTLDLKGERSALEAAVTKASLDAVKLDIFHAVKQTYYEYAYVTQAVKITREIIELVRYLESIARARYTAGASPHADVIRTQVELGKLQDRLATLRDWKRPLRSRLNAVMNRPVHQELAPPPEIPVMRLCMSGEELHAFIATSNPRLRAMDASAAAKQAGIKLAHKDYFPDLTFGLQTIVTGDARSPGVKNADEDPIIASLSMNLPLWQKTRDAAILEARSKLRAVQQDKEELGSSLHSDLEMTLYKYNDAERKIDLYQKTLIPKAEQSLGVSLEAFQTGQGSSLDLMDAEKTLLELKLAFLRSLADQAQQLAEMETIVGREIPCELQEIERTGDELNLELPLSSRPDSNNPGQEP